MRLLARGPDTLGRIFRQRNVIAECRLQSFHGAILIAAPRAASDSDGADHLAVDNDWKASRRSVEIIQKDGTYHAHPDCS